MKQMKRLFLNENEFGDEGGAALLECLHNIEELAVEDCGILPEIAAKMKERASENGVQLKLCSSENRRKLDVENFSEEGRIELLTALGIDPFSIQAV